MFLIDWCKENVEGLFGLTTTSRWFSPGFLAHFPSSKFKNVEWNVLTIFCSHWKERVTESGRSGMGFSFDMIGTPSLCSADRKDSCTFSADWQEVLLFSCYLCVHSQGLRKLQLRQNQQSHLQRKNPQKSPASARVSGQLLQMFNVSDRLM